MDSNQPPRRDRETFTCPYCGASGPLTRFSLYYRQDGRSNKRRFHPAEYIQLSHRSRGDNDKLTFFYATRCDSCARLVIWENVTQRYPSLSVTYQMFSEMPPALATERAWIEEAQSIRDSSPASAAVLLRLTLASLCERLGCPSAPGETYVAFLQGTLRTKVQANLIEKGCIRAGRPLAPNALDRQDDTLVVDALLNLLKDVIRVYIDTTRS